MKTTFQVPENESFVSHQCSSLRKQMSTKYCPMIDIMNSLLNFNPYFRPSALECLKHPVFDVVRDQDKEKILKALRHQNKGWKPGQNTNTKIELDVDHQMAFDYENPSNAKYTEHQIKQKLAKEILDF